MPLFTRAAVFRKLVDIATAAEDIWIGTRSDVAAKMLAK
jgi:hypothetical protein